MRIGSHRLMFQPSTWVSSFQFRQNEKNHILHGMFEPVLAGAGTVTGVVIGIKIPAAVVLRMDVEDPVRPPVSLASGFVLG